MPTSSSEVGPESSELVSVVVTCYNQARYLPEAIESVLAQTHRPVELVVVDDGSQDHTRELMRNYPHACYFRFPNGGVVRARNRGLHHSTGKYIVFLDGDDRLLPDAVENQLAALASSPDAAFAVGRYRYISADGAAREWATDPVVHGDQYRELLLNNFITMPGMVMHRRSVFDDVAAGGFSLRADHASDYELYLRIARQKPVVRHDCMVAEYRVHDTNASNRSVMMLRGTMKVYRWQRAHVKGNKLYEDAYRTGGSKWRERYGGEVVATIRTRLKAGSWRDRWHVVIAAAALLRDSPRVLVRHLWRKCKATLGVSTQQPKGAVDR